MTGLVRKATLLSGGLLLVAGIAVAGVPNASKSTLPPGIQLGGQNAAAVAGGRTLAAVADPKAQAIVIVRDAGNNPVMNSTVVLDFSACTTALNYDMHVSNTQPFASMTLNCPGKTITAVTDALGQAIFDIVGGANAVGNSAGLGLTPCINVVADSQPLGTLRMAAYDLNSASGVNPADLALFLSTLFQSPAGYRQRCDYNGNGTVDVADLALFLKVQFGAGSTFSGTGGSCF